ncbi:MAG: ankyrin repeat domain-containing protein [Proteobacteria bacterium]|nr:ankyrin repeat domain-containing protein [Pseudomonadota bacterium]
MKRGPIDQDDHPAVKLRNNDQEDSLVFENGDLQQIELLIKRRKNTPGMLDKFLELVLGNVLDEYYLGKFTLDTSVYEKYSKIAAILLLEGASLVRSLKNICPVELMHSAVSFNDLNFLQVLLNAGININQKGKSHASLLHITVRNELEKDSNIVGSLLKFGADPSIEDESGMTPLHLVKRRSDASDLLKGGADIEALDKEGATPLFSAAMRHKLSIFNFLINNGANPYYVNADHLNVMDFAKINKQGDFARKIKKSVGYDASFLLQAKQFFSNLFTKCMQLAIAQGKKLLVMLGEAHGYYRCQQIEKLILLIVKELNISHLMLELLPQDILNKDLINDTAILRYNKKHFGLKLVGMDKYKNTVDNKWNISREGIERRNVGIVETIKDTNEHAVSINGVCHLLGILNQFSQVNTSQFFIIPINLATNFRTEGEFKKESDFSRDPAKVIQFSKELFDGKAAQEVICKQNKLSHF